MLATRSLLRVSALLVSLVLCGACGMQDSFACTLIGDQSGLTVRFTNLASTIVRVEASESGDPSRPAYVADCSRAYNGCGSQVHFAGYTAWRTEIKLVTTTGTVSGSIDPAYKVTYPNGPKCAPRQTAATVVMNAANGQLTNQ